MATNGRRDSTRNGRRKTPPRGDAGTRSIRILVADDQAIDRKGLIALLQTQPDFNILGEANSSQQAVDMCIAMRPDVLITNVRMPEREDVATIPAIRAACPETRILAVAERSEGRCVVLNPPRLARRNGSKEGALPTCSQVTDCLQLSVARGALGAIRRSAEPEDLYRAVRAVASGSAWYELSTASRLLERALGLGPSSASQELSGRELEVASLIADGLSNKEIGSALHISEPTVKKHVGHILEKLGLQDRLQVGLYIARNPLLLTSQGAEIR